jgi:hypothetical protein
MPQASSPLFSDVKPGLPPGASPTSARVVLGETDAQLGRDRDVAQASRYLAFDH